MLVLSTVEGYLEQIVGQFADIAPDLGAGRGVERDQRLAQVPGIRGFPPRFARIRLLDVSARRGMETAGFGQVDGIRLGVVQKPARQRILSRLRRAGAPAEAVPVLEAALERSGTPPSTDLLAELALAYYATGDLDVDSDLTIAGEGRATTITLTPCGASSRRNESVSPATAVLEYNGNPTLAKLYTEIADGWLAAAMSLNQRRGFRQMSVAPKISPEASASCVKTQPEFRGLARMAAAGSITGLTATTCAMSRPRESARSATRSEKFPPSE